MTRPEIFDQAAALAQVDGDSELLQELVTLFLDDYPRLLGEITEAIARGEGQALARTARSLKGAVGALAAQGAFAAALTLEQIGKAGDLTQAAEAYASLEKELAALSSALAALKGYKGE